MTEITYLEYFAESRCQLMKGERNSVFFHPELLPQQQGHTLRHRENVGTQRHLMIGTECLM